MPVSIVAVAPFVGGKANKNGKSPLYLNHISGDRIPNDALVVDGTIAESLGLKVGYTGSIGWSQGDDRVYEGKTRSNVRYFMMDGNSSFVDKLETAVAKETAKVSMSATRPVIARATAAPKVTPAAPTVSEELTNRFLDAKNEDEQITVIKDALLSFAGNDEAFNDWFAGVGSTQEILEKAKA